MTLDWAMRRRIYTILIILGTILIVGLLIFFITKPAPSCTDGKQNQDELGIDCGGVCPLQCKGSAKSLTTLWQKSFPVRKGVYDVAALVENPNMDAGIANFTYTVELFDASERTILSRNLTSFANPGDHFMLFAGGLDTGGIPAAKASLTINPEYRLVRSELSGERKITVLKYDLLSPDEKPRLLATLQNETTHSFYNVPVSAMVSDKNGPVAVSETVIDELPPRGKASVVFTWPEPLQYAAEGTACEAPVDVVLVTDRSGSMQSDGKNPSQPLSLAKDAAKEFVQKLSSADQVGYLSFATDASTPIDHILSKDFAKVSSVIGATEIATSGPQYTNIAAALDVAREELESTRARKEAKPAVVFMTDGEPTYPKNPTDERDEEYPRTLASEAAARLKDAGFSLYVIGLGKDVKADYLSQLASFPEYYFPAASGAELSHIYKQIGGTICKKGPSVVEIIPRLNEMGKTTTR